MKAVLAAHGLEADGGPLGAALLLRGWPMVADLARLVERRHPR